MVVPFDAPYLLSDNCVLRVVLGYILEDVLILIIQKMNFLQKCVFLAFFGSVSPVTPANLTTVALY